MREMKDSGIEWIGAIPKDWKILKLNNVASKITDYVASGSFADLNKNVTYLDEPDYAMLVRTADLSGTKDKRVYINKDAYEFLGNSNLHGGEIILSNIGSVGNVFIYTPMYERGSLAPNAIMIDGCPNNRYVYYWFLNPIANEELKRIGGNAVQLKFNKTQLRQFKVLCPSIFEQEKIVKYLDEKCAKIDSIIEKQQQIIEKLKEYKLSVINEKTNINTGVTCHLSYLGQMKNGLNFTDVDDGEKIMFLGVGDFKDYFVLDNKIMFSTITVNENTISEELMLESGDIIFVRSNGSKELVGRAVMVDAIDFKLTYTGFAIRYRNKRKDVINSKYLLYYFRSPDFRKLLEKNSQGSNISNMNQDLLGNIEINIPKMDYQNETVSFLDEKCKLIDKTIEDRQGAIDKLLDYKKSLIYEVVTGKKEV